MSKDFIKKYGKEVYDKVWEESDDAIESVVSLEDLYEDVPDKLKNVPVYILELHHFPEDMKEEVLDWLKSEEQNDTK